MKIFFIMAILLVFSIYTAAEPSEKQSGTYFEIYLLSQTLVAYKDGQEIFREQISSGRGWHTSHNMRYKSVYYVYKIEGSKARSIKPGKGGYNVETPWKVYLTPLKSLKRQVGHINLHGTRSAWSKYPSSKGCFRQKISQAKIAAKLAFVGMEVRIKLAKAPAKSI